MNLPVCALWHSPPGCTLTPLALGCWGGGALLTPGPAQQDQVAVLCCTGWGAADGSPEQLLWAVAAHCTHFIDQLPSN